MIPSLADLKKTPTIECSEAVVLLNTLEPSIVCAKSELLVRAALREKIWLAQNRLSSLEKDFKLLVYDGYRHPEEQAGYYEKMYKRLKKQYPSDDAALLEEKTNLMIAHPAIAGHPTGGAIDATILYKEKELDMGCSIYDFDQPNKIPTYSDKISIKQLSNRKLLLDVLLLQDFAPFYGEWWHYSYGDKEWAFFYKQPNAIYDQLSLDPTKNKKETR